VNILKKKSIVFLGEKLGPEHHPILYRWAKRNPETLEKSLLSLAKLPGGSVGHAMNCLESDLRHG